MEEEKFGNILLSTKMPKELKDVADWIPLKRYLEWFGETKPMVEKRIQMRIWKPGVQWSRPNGAGIWISIKGVNTWASVHKPRSEKGDPAPILPLGNVPDLP